MPTPQKSQSPLANSSTEPAGGDSHLRPEPIGRQLRPVPLRQTGRSSRLQSQHTRTRSRRSLWVEMQSSPLGQARLTPQAESSQSPVPELQLGLVASQS